MQQPRTECEANLWGVGRACIQSVQLGQCVIRALCHFFCQDRSLVRRVAVEQHSGSGEGVEFSQASTGGLGRLKARLPVRRNACPPVRIQSFSDRYRCRPKQAIRGRTG